MLGVVGALLFLRLGAAPLYEPDEGRYASIPREMLASGDFVTPRLNGVLYFEKPALYYWLNAASIAVFGMSPWAVRLWSALGALAAALLTFLLARDLAGPRAARWAAAALATGPLFLLVGRTAVIDMPLASLVTLSLVAFWFAHRSVGLVSRLWWHAAFAAAALAVLAKGLVGLVLPAAVAAAYVVLTRQWRILGLVPWVTGLALFGAIAVPWHVMVAGRNPDFAWFYFVHEHLLRYATSDAQREGPAWFYPALLAVGCVPWSGLLPAVARLAPRRGWRDWLAEHTHLVFLWSWFGVTLAFFSASHSKLATYIVPALPPLAVLAGMALARWADGALEPDRWDRVALGLAGVLTGTIGAVLVVVGVRGHAKLTPDGSSLPVLALLGGVIVLGALAVLVGAARMSGRRLPPLLLTAAVLVGVMLVEAWVVVGRRLSVEPAAAALRPRLAEGDLVFTYRTLQECLWVYLDRRVGVVARTDELAFGSERLPGAERERWFPSVEQFRRVWESEQRVWVVTRPWGVARMQGDGLRPGHVAWRNDRWLVLCNRPLPPG